MDARTFASMRHEMEKRALSDSAKASLLAVGALGGTLALNSLVASRFEKTLRKSKRNKQDQELAEKIIAKSPYQVSKSRKMDYGAILLDATKDESASAKEMFNIDVKPGSKHVIVNSKANVPSVLAHELGHGSFHDTSIGHFMQTHGATLAGALTALAPVAGLLGAGGSAGKYSKALATGAVAAPVVAHLIADLPEIAASTRAMKMLRGEGASEEQLARARSQLIHAYGTYLTSVPMYAAPGLLGQAVGHLDKMAHLQKSALLERLVRLGATDIPKTPRLLMKQRSPQELAGLQHGVENWWGKKVSDPLMNVANKGLSKLPEGKLKSMATSGAKMVAQDPLGAVAANAVPIPGAFPAYLGAKKGLERVIDRVAPLATSVQPTA